MTRAAAIGEHVRLAGYALAGVEVHAAGDDGAVLEAWERLDGDVVCLILTPTAHAALAPRLAERPRVVWTVLPQ
jgi:hypothetical protein